MLFTQEINFDPNDPQAALAAVPAAAAVFALRGPSGEPYLNRTSDLRRRLHRLLTPSPAQSKRLQLAGLVRRVAWTETASEFTAQLLLYQASLAAFGERARKRLHLTTPFFVRVGMRNRYPRCWITNSLSLDAAADLFGPFPSRNAAERYLEQVLDLYLLRRCFQDLDPDPAFPGCIYSEMKKCLAPCYGGCSDERYADEAAAVHAFLRTGGASLLATLATERDRASEALDFEAAAAAHTRHTKAEAVAALAPEIARALQVQRGVLVQPSAVPDEVSLYLLENSLFTGPVAFSVLGMRLPNEQSGSSSLFAHPAAFAAVPLASAGARGVLEWSARGSTEAQGGSAADPAPPQSPDDRLQAALASLDALAAHRHTLDKDRAAEHGRQELCDHQALLARWYFRPGHKRQGELLLAEPASGAVPMKALLRACARVYRAHVEKHAPR
ncbi:excinuclease ABC subunit C [Acidipila sp. EB88]|nr:excinuclease ABC subunit C [Acidipila sp. EB88]